MREKLARRRKERQVQIETLTGKNLSPSAASSCQTTGGSSSSGGIVTSTSSQAIASSTLSLNAGIIQYKVTIATNPWPKPRLRLSA